MVVRLKLESVKLLAYYKSLSLQLKDLLLIYIPQRKILDNTLLENFLKKKNCFLDRVIKEAATRGVLCKTTFLEISQNSQENTCTRVSFLIKLLAS